MSKGESTTDSSSDTASSRQNDSGASSEIKIQPQRRLSLDPKTWQCWAHTRSKRRCSTMISVKEGEPIPVPYCDVHLHAGDYALKVVRHPFAGKCLVARWDLPNRYRIAFHGARGRCKPCDVEDRAISFYPPNITTGKNTNAQGKLVTTNYNGVLNPGGTGDVIQYAACPGPNERQNMRSTFRYWGKRNGTYGGLEFVTIEAIPKGQQLVQWYGPGWWSARGVRRRDVGTNRYPAPLRIKRFINKQNENINKSNLAHK